MRIRRGTPADALLLAEHRAAVWHEVGEWNVADLVRQIPVWAAFLRKHLEDGTFVAFIAEANGQAIGSGGILVHLAMPRPDIVSERAGRVQSLYVKRAERRRGVGRAIMERLLLFAREAALISVSLHPSEEGRPLYIALGFKAADEMLLRFT